MAKWKIAMGVCGPRVLYETVTAKTKEEAVKKIIEKEKESEYDDWAFFQEIQQMQRSFIGDSRNDNSENNNESKEEFVPQPESYWTERYENLRLYSQFNGYGIITTG